MRNGLGHGRAIFGIGLNMFLWALCSSGCVRATRSDPAIPEAAADERSDEDRRRGGARTLEAQPSPEAPLVKLVTDSETVSWPAQRRTKWRRLDLDRINMMEPTLRCEVRSEPATARIELDLSNALGTMIGHGTGSAGSSLLVAKIEEEGTHFLRIRASGPGDAARYSLRCTWTETPPAPVVARRPPPIPPPRPCCAFPDPWERRLRDAVTGEIVQSFRENGKMVLLINRGSDDGLQVGTEGTVLDGRSGTEPLSGGDLQVVKIVDGRRCVAESTVRSLGRNNRVLLFPKERPASVVSPPAPAPAPAPALAPAPGASATSGTAPEPAAN